MCADNSIKDNRTTSIGNYGHAKRSTELGPVPQVGKPHISQQKERVAFIYSTVFLSEIKLLACVTRDLGDAEHISCNPLFLSPYHFSFFALQALMTMKMQSILSASRPELPRSSYIS